MKPLVFYFHFLVNLGNEKLYGFIIQDPAQVYAALGTSTFAEFNEKLYDEVTAPIESEYGVHNWSTGPSERVDAIGYTTSEVDESSIPALMDAWRDWFVKTGAEVSKTVVIFDDRFGKSDFQIYNMIKVVLAPPPDALP